jgi:hypothetical protein
MRLYKKEGNTVQILSFPGEDVEKGDYLLVEEKGKKKALVIQVIDVQYASIPGILEDFLRECPEDERITGEDFDPLGITSQITYIQDSCLLLCKIRAGVDDGRLSQWSSWLPSRSGSLIKKLSASSLLSMINVSNDLPMLVGETKDASVLTIDARCLDGKLNIVTGKKETGKSPVEYLYDIGFLGHDVSAVHCIWVSGHEMNLLKKTSTKVSHNPESNMKLASGVAPVPKMLKKGITVSLATDGCASNDNLDMFEAMRTAALLHKVSSMDASVISSYDVLKMATIDGARAIGLEDRIGSLEVGKKADVILVDLTPVHMRPLNDVIGTLVYCANGRDVETVIVDGKLLMQGGEVQSVDERSAVKEAEENIMKHKLPT